MNEFSPKYGNDQLMHFVAEKSGGHRNPNEKVKLANPQQIGEAISKAAKESDEANADDPTFLEKVLGRPEGALLLLGILSVGAGILNSPQGQELLQRILG